MEPTRSEHQDRFDVLGVGIDAIDVPRAIDDIGSFIAEDARATITFCTVSSILSARKDPRVAEAIGSSSIVAPDGMPLVWLGRRAGREVARVYGPDFMLDLLAATGARYKHYFFGGRAGVAEQMSVKLTERFPGIRVVGFSSPPENLSADQDLGDEIARIEQAEPDIVWIGLGHPKQELWMHANRGKLSAPVLAAVGAAFDFHSGAKKEAPGWMKRSGLQWLHRLLKEPRRLWRRYLVGNTTFLFLLLRERFSK